MQQDPSAVQSQTLSAARDPFARSTVTYLSQAAAGRLAYVARSGIRDHIEMEDRDELERLVAAYVDVCDQDGLEPLPIEQLAALVQARLAC